MNRLAAPLALAALLISPALAEEQREQHTYRVHHALFGDIGTLSHVILVDGPVVRVSTRGEVRVQVLGVTVHHMMVAWDEEWRDDDLRDFRGLTIRNGNTMRVHAWAESGRMTILNGEGTQDVPAGTRPIDPWSPQLFHAAALMSPETGRIISLPVTDDGPEPMAGGAAPGRPLHRYTMGSNQFYFDDTGTLVRSEYGDITGTVTFTLLDSAGQHMAQAPASR